MADRPPDRRSVQDFVQNVINAVTNLQTQTSQVERNEESSSAAFTALSDELNARFQIPRGASRGRRIATATNSTIVPAATFNPRQNYSSPLQRTRRCPRGGARNSTTTSESAFMYKDVCLLPEPEYDQVPRGAAKANLVQRGLYVDAFKLDKSWSEARLYMELASLFKEALCRSTLEDIGFEFVKSSGCNIVPVQVPRGQEKNARVMKHISGQGPLYIRALEALSYEKNEYGDEDHSPVLVNNDGDIRDYMEGRTLLPVTTVHYADVKPGPSCQDRDAVSPSSCQQIDTVACEVQRLSSGVYQNSAQLKPGQSTSFRNEDATPVILQCETSNQLSEKRNEDVLKEMFPDLNEEKVKQALEFANSDLRLAINKVLEDHTAIHHPVAAQIADDEKDDWLWEAPLVVARSAMINTDDAAHCLKKFTEEAVKPFGCGLDIEVDRKTDLLKQMLRKYTNPGFDITKNLCIEFTDEIGVDAGGLTREYFYLLMERLKQGPGGATNLFEGQLGHLVPIHNYDVLSGGLFVLAGKMILHSILNDCNGVPGMSPAIISYLMTGRRDSAVEHVTLEDVPDLDLKEKLKELLCCKEDSLADFTNPLNPMNISELLVSAGYPHLNITGQRRHLAYECILLYEVVTKRIPAMDDLRKGLAAVKVSGTTLIDLLIRFPELQQRVFPPNTGRVQANLLRLHIQWEDCFDPVCQSAQKFLHQFIDEVHQKDGADENTTLEDLVLFWTGYSYLPPDVTTKLYVKYLENHPDKVLAESKACSMELYIPVVHKDYSMFKEYLKKSISYGKIGFGKM